MVTTEALMVLKNQLLAKASEAVRAGNVPALSAISAKAAACERLIAEAQDLDSLSATVQRCGRSGSPI